MDLPNLWLWSGLRIGAQLMDGLSAGRSPPRRKEEEEESPDLYRCSVVDTGNIFAPRFSFSCFYGAPGFGPNDSVIFNVNSSWVGIQYSVLFSAS